MLLNLFMRRIIKPCNLSGLSIFIYLMLLVAFNARAEDRILESIHVAPGQGYSIVDIELNQQLTVSSYAPLKGGDQLRIKVKRTGSAAQITEQPTNYETLSWSPTPEVPLFEVTVDLDGAIVLGFKKYVTYEVRGGSNAFHIFVKVFHAGAVGGKARQAAGGVVIKQYQVKGAVNPKFATAMNDAREAMLDKDYSRAVQLYTKVVLDGPKSMYAKAALEYLGLARERKGQLAHARVAYKKYIKLYPEGKDTERVKQRLAGLLTARAAPREKLRKGKRKPHKETPGFQWDTFGSVSQFYNRDESKRNKDDARLNRSTLQNNMDVTSRIKTKDVDVTARFSGSYDVNLEVSDPDEKRISSSYIDVRYKPLDVGLRVGRQSRSTGGVLGRFDGLLFSFPAAQDVKLNIVAGYPVESSKNTFLDKTRYFYGISADLGTYLNAWDFNMFYIEERDHSLLNRRAVGGEARFFKRNYSFFTFLDYDIHHDELNTLLFTGQYVFPDRTTFNVSYDHRLSPILTTRNAIQSQGSNNINSVDDLLAFFSEDEIKKLARDRTATSDTLSFGVSRPLTEKFQFNADVRWSNFSRTDASTFSGSRSVFNVQSSDGSGDEYAYSADITGSSLLTSGDLYVFGFRFNDSDTSNITTFTLNARYPITRNLRINPKFRFDLRDNKDNGTTRWTYRPSVRITYRILKALQLELETGGEWEKQERTVQERQAAATTDPNDSDHTKGYFVIVGYRFDF